MAMAVSAVKEKRMTLKQATIEFNVPMSTVWDKVTDRVPLVPKRRTVLTAEKEGKIKDMIITSSRRGNGKTKQELQRINYYTKGVEHGRKIDHFPRQQARI
ncbi:hypothetical protein ElyMa_005114800 [Elysia marginata]|uniref:HTH psq-type domain-containing protein n=1 Tax=Elysia marginata TaxID=1093978 RepID=A0AAV4JP02_9GAST|nr:hypothetical protein ElyMa_005114800 [Elysia marginata]